MEERPERENLRKHHTEAFKRPTREESEKRQNAGGRHRENLERKLHQSVEKGKKERGTGKPSSKQHTGDSESEERKRRSGGRLNVLIDHAYHLHCLLVKKRTSDGRKDLNEKNLRKHHTRSIQNDPQGRIEKRPKRRGGRTREKSKKGKSPPKVEQEKGGKTR
ncbi:hypothetical protein TNIN_27821 [Trichonephila inaurata madagascariensis]|uniref:Uncharacterized protein n=1 Tax=Trichonephila inaurata madagascariensis TaxID=2747483 RepID=A0A8X6YHE3_9ARAC|nr:hypothetical protein TNIN_27821 [Trichonephila inaurata madagascariensis]